MGYISTCVPSGKVNAGPLDVIMGRGKGVSEWPGNIFFRQVVNKHREAYTLASRNTKVAVAQIVIDDVHANGSRFMREKEEGVWVEIAQGRAVEKCCQALREKEKPVVAKDSIFKNEPIGLLAIVSKKLKPAPPTPKNNKKKKPEKKVVKKKRPPPPAAANARTKKRSKAFNFVSIPFPSPSPRLAVQKKRDYHASDDNTNTDGSVTVSEKDSDEEKTSDDDDDESGSSTDSESASEEVQKNSKGQDRTPVLMDSPVNRVLCSQEGPMMMKLASFKQQHGHCAVPPEWPSDPLLADWCIVQRQVMQCALMGYVTATKEQQSLVERLNALNFVWDYENWHWEYHFDQLVCSYHIAEAKGDKAVDSVSITWLEDQRRRQLENKLYVRSVREKKLYDVGITLT
jgi:hypothetical protein